MLFRRQPSCGEGCNGHLSVQVFVALASSKNVRGQSTVLTTIGHPSCHGRVSIGVQSSLSKGRGLSEPSKISNGLHEAKVVILVSADMRPNVCDCFGATLKLVECDSNECPPPPVIAPQLCAKFTCSSFLILPPCQVFSSYFRDVSSV